MNIKIWSHVMPWDIDYALLMAIQLKKAKYYLPEGIQVTVDIELNLTDYLYDWERSNLPKDYFKQKFKTLLLLLGDYNVNYNIYEGDKKYGHLDQQKRIVSTETDFYVGICPDIYFSEYALRFLIEAASQIPNKYFVITPQVSKVGDQDWDRIVDPKFINIPYVDYLKVDTFDVAFSTANSGEKYLEPLERTKFAGWFDLYSKTFYEELCEVQKDWTGYGPWDHYSMIISDYCKARGVDVQQYVLRGETIWMYPSGPLLEENSNGFSQYYRDRLITKEIPSQRLEFESNMQTYLLKGLDRLKKKGLIV